MKRRHVAYGMTIVCLAAFCLFAYMIVSFAASKLNLGTVWTNVISTAIALVGGIIWWFVDYKKNPIKPEKEPIKMSIFGWALFLSLFALLFASAEVLGNFIYAVGPDVGVTSDYANMSANDLYVYIVSAVTIGPVMEEIFFRRFIFGKLRQQYPFWISCTVSGLFFIVFHGTLMHIPIAIGVTVLTCMFYDMTKQFGWCLFLHMLFNYLAASYIIVIPMAWWIAGIAYAVILALFICAYVYRKQVFGKYLAVGSLEQFEAFLDDKRKHFETLSQTDESADQEQKSEL